MTVEQLMGELQRLADGTVAGMRLEVFVRVKVKRGEEDRPLKIPTLDRSEYVPYVVLEPE